MEWLATAIRIYKGQASVVQAQGFDDLAAEQLKRLFLEARSRDYQKLLHEAKKLLALPPARTPATPWSWATWFSLRMRSNRA